MIENAIVIDAWDCLHSFNRSGDSGKAVLWASNGVEIRKEVLDKESQSLVPCISQSGELMIIVFGNLEGIYSPNRASIFNADGSLKMNLEIPDLISEDYREFERQVGISSAKLTIKFLWPT